MSSSQPAIVTSSLAKGRHLLLDLYGCDADALNDEPLLRNSIVEVAEIAGATVIETTSHAFIPQGVTALALLAESHISIHTWPEAGYAAVDIFTCGKNMDPRKCVPLLRKKLQATEWTERCIDRSITPNKEREII